MERVCVVITKRLKPKHGIVTCIGRITGVERKGWGSGDRGLDYHLGKGKAFLWFSSAVEFPLGRVEWCCFFVRIHWSTDLSCRFA